MYISCYLIVYKCKGFGGRQRDKIRLSTRQPTLDRRERAVRVTLNLPDALWEEPQLSAKIEVPSDQVSRPHIDAQVMQNIEELVSQELGVRLELTVCDRRTTIDSGD